MNVRVRLGIIQKVWPRSECQAEVKMSGHGLNVGLEV